MKRTVLSFAITIILILCYAVPETLSQVKYGDSHEGIKLVKNNNFEIEDVTYFIKSDYGYRLKVRSVRPKLSRYPAKQFPAVLRIGGGWGFSTFLLNASLTRKAAADGLIIVAFDSEMKDTKKYPVGSSQRDYSGFRDQEDAAKVLRSILEHPNVNPDAVGVWSHSNGITLASGVLGREKFRDISDSVKFILDDEGPYCPRDMLQNRDIKYHTRGMKRKWRKVINSKVGEMKDYNSEDEFFYERCAVNFIGNFKGIYQRVQAGNDHETLYYHGHAVAMLNAATNGKAKWTRLNREPKNITYYSLQDPDGIDIENVIDLNRVNGPNDRRIWELLYKLFNQ